MSYPPLAFDLVHVLSTAQAKKRARPVFVAVLRDPQELHDPRYPGEEATWRRLLRGYLAIGLVRFADATAADDLLKLAIAGLGKLKYAPARSSFESMLDSPDPDTRQEAKQALKKLG
ncbi:hypothetical protein ACFORH_14020 [Amycolatopsis roodepoortensis]|uniref:HEAT repeat protein n=1 Tax=Amycolatopsis roodepoortensis TaxID=700274 RepID=A0ABR9KZC6_9PSEU|nr:hypothetical protein [Amycolatopsis roodepoortensis]MBE1573461.1 HEAT repeat protein [Amycolatopsis roodepoortensis]